MVKMRLQLLLLICALFNISYAMVADLYLNKDKFGEFFKLEINEKGCTNVPLNWENQAVSLDTHGSCIKFYDLPYCRGKYVALQPFHGTFQDNLQTLGFSKLISSASPCGPKVPTGRYYIQNGADGSVLTIETKNNTPIARTHAFKPYISKGQQFQIEKVALADYEIVPRLHQKLNPLTFDMSLSTAAHPVRRLWKIESVYRGRYLIKNEWSNRCLYKSDSGKVEEHECVAWSPNQEWVFRSIKVKPYFPTKEDLKKNPLRPDDKLPFEPLDDAFSPIPYKPNTVNSFASLNGFAGPPPLPPSSKKNNGGKKGKKPYPVQIQRPGPLVINPGEPFPPVFPFPIVPKLPVQPYNSIGNKKQQQGKPPVPHVRHPGPLPFPAVPVVTDTKRPPISPFDTYNVHANKKTKNKDEESKEENDDEKDEIKSEEKDEEKDETKSEEKDDTKSDEQGQEENDQDSGERDDTLDNTSNEQNQESSERDENNDEAFRPPGPQNGDHRYGPKRPGDHRFRPEGPTSYENENAGLRPRPSGPNGATSYTPGRPNGANSFEHGSDEYPNNDQGYYDEDEESSDELEDDRVNGHKRRKQKEEEAGVKYSDYRLHF